MRRLLFNLGIFCTAAMLVLVCTGCQKAPDENAVISKSDGSSESNAYAATSATHAAADVQEVSRYSVFTSTDGSVSFTMDIQQKLLAADMPVVSVTTHFLTAEDAESAAYALFPDAVFYEAEPDQSENFSRSEIQAKINRWSQYMNDAALQKLLGLEDVQDVKDTIKSFVERYTLLYETAPEENPHTLCQWTMRKSSAYYIPEDALADIDTSNDNDEISAQFMLEGIPYYFTVSTRNKSDFKVNTISTYIYSGLSPCYIDDSIYRAELCRTEKPTQAQLDAAAESAAQMLSSLNLGQWQIDECYINRAEYGEAVEYVICVNAVPVLNGVPALRQPQISTLRRESYAPVQYLTDANFSFSANGTLLSFHLSTPLDIQGIVNNNVSTLSIEELLDRAQEYLELTDAYNYGTYFSSLLDLSQEKILCDVEVSEIAYGLSRVRTSQSDTEYYYTPAIAFRGYATFTGKDSGNLYYVDQVPETFVVLNAVDGSIIDPANE